MKLVLFLVVISIAYVSAQNCGACPDCSFTDNPPLTTEGDCSFTAVVVVDESGSLGPSRERPGGFSNQVRAAVTSFATRLGAGARVARDEVSYLGLVRFNSAARLGSTNQLSAINSEQDGLTFAAQLNDYEPTARTDWAEALRLTRTTNWVKAGSAEPAVIDFVLFITDGNPTLFDGECDAECSAVPNALNDVDVATACYEARLLKTSMNPVPGRQPKLFIVAIGESIGENLDAIRLISGPVQWDEQTNTNSVATSDFLFSNQVAELGTALSNIIADRCGCEEEAVVSVTCSAGFRCLAPGETAPFIVSASFNGVEEDAMITGVTITGPFDRGLVCSTPHVVREQNGNTRTLTLDTPVTVALGGATTAILNCSWQPITDADVGRYNVIIESIETGACNFVQAGLPCNTDFSVSSPRVSISTVGVTCPGDADGRAQATAAGGVAPYTFSFSNGAAFGPSSDTQATAAPLAIGEYSVTLTDAEGCEATANFIVPDLDMCPRADLSIVKSVAFDQVSEGPVVCVTPGRVSPYLFTLEIVNNGPGVATNVVVSDSLPAPLAIAGAISGANCSGAVGQRDITCSLGSMAVGSSVTITIPFSASATQAVNEVAVNWASVASPEDMILHNNRDWAAVRLCTDVDLVISKTDGRDSVRAGETGEYTVTITNQGVSTASLVTFEDDWPIDGIIRTGMPEGVDCERLGGEPAGSDDVHCNLGNIAPGQTVTLTFPYRAAKDACPGARVNAAGVWSDESERDPRNNIATDFTEIVGSADVSVTKGDGRESVVGGRQYTYDIDVSNAGPSNANDVRVVDHWPSELEFLSFAAPAGVSCVLVEHGSERDLSCNLGDLECDASVRISITYRVPGDISVAQVANRVVAKSYNTPDPNEANNKAIDVNRIAAEANLSVVKSSSASNGLFIDRNPNTYTIAITNNGPSDARGVCLIDNWPRVLVPFKGQEFVSADQGRCYTEGYDFYCDFGSIAAGQTVNVNVAFTVSESCAVCGDEVRNTVSVWSVTGAAQGAPVVSDDAIATILCTGDNEKKRNITPALAPLEVETDVSVLNGKPTLNLSITNRNQLATIEDAVWIVKDAEQGTTHRIHLSSDSRYVQTTDCMGVRSALLEQDVSFECSITLNIAIEKISKLAVRANNSQASAVVVVN